MDTKSSRWKLNWPELIGLVGLIASLVFVGFEIRQNTRVARAEAYRAFVTEVNSIYLHWSNPEQVGVMQKALVNPADLTRVERSQAFAVSMALFRVYEGLHKEVTQGILDDSALMLLSQSEWNFEIQRQMWPEISRNLTPDFVEYVEETHGLSR